MTKSDFYIVLPSNSSMAFYPENTTSHFVTKLPRDIHMDGVWQVALTEIQIPLTFAHLAKSECEQTVYLKLIRRQRSVDNEILSPKNLDYEPKLIHDDIAPGLYDNIQDLVGELI